jgi:hypothetical protein
MKRYQLDKYKKIDENQLYWDFIIEKGLKNDYKKWSELDKEPLKISKGAYISKKDVRALVKIMIERQLNSTFVKVNSLEDNLSEINNNINKGLNILKTIFI